MEMVRVIDAAAAATGAGSGAQRKKKKKKKEKNRVRKEKKKEIALEKKAEKGVTCSSHANLIGKCPL